MTALMLAAAAGHEVCVKELLYAGAHTCALLSPDALLVRAQREALELTQRRW